MQKQYILTAEEMKRYDNNTSEIFRMPSLVLMERAALATVKELCTLYPEPVSVLIAAGIGGNGGDGLAIGRLLAQKGYPVTFYVTGNRDKCSGETRRQLEIGKQYGYPILNQIPEMEYTIVVDALFGIGLSRALGQRDLETVRTLNQMGKRGSFLCAVDIPSGICAMRQNRRSGK